MKRFSGRLQNTLQDCVISVIMTHERLQTLKLYSLQRRRERYCNRNCIILIWKIIENKPQNLSDPILCNFSDRRGRSCAIFHVDSGRLGTLAYNSFRWGAIRLLNSLPKTICDIKNCSVCSFKQRLDHYLSSIPDLPCSPGYNNSLDGGDYLQRWTPRDDMCLAGAVDNVADSRSL